MGAVNTGTKATGGAAAGAGGLKKSRLASSIKVGVHADGRTAGLTPCVVAVDKTKASLNGRKRGCTTDTMSADRPVHSDAALSTTVNTSEPERTRFILLR